MKSAASKELTPELFRDILLSVVPEFPEKPILHLYGASQVQSYQPGEFLIIEGEVCKGVLMVWRGTVRICLHNGGEKCADLNEISSPALLGLSATFTGDRPVASIQALTQVEAAFIPRAAFMEAMVRFPTASIALSPVLNEELNSAYERLRILRSARQAPGFVAN
jgi:CRP-like cAMP-binding protein